MSASESKSPPAAPSPAMNMATNGVASNGAGSGGYAPPPPPQHSHTSNHPHHHHLHNQQSSPPPPPPSAQTTWTGGCGGGGSVRTGVGGGGGSHLNEKEQLALSDLLSNSFTASFWNFRTRFERYMLFFAFILCSVLLVCVVLMIFLIVNTSLLKCEQNSFFLSAFSSSLKVQAKRRRRRDQFALIGFC